MALNVENTNLTNNFHGLRAWDIHEVVLEEIKSEHGTFNDADKSPSHSISFKFSNDNGDYTVRLFCPVGKDECKEGCARKLRKTNSGEYESPSREETFVYNILHICSILSEENQKRVKAFYSKVDPTLSVAAFDKFCSGIAKILNENIVDKKVELELKLVGNDKGYAITPFILGISKKTDESGNRPCYINNNYIARKGSDVVLSFSDYEMNTQKRYKAESAAKQSKVSDFDFDDGDDANEFDQPEGKSLDDFNMEDI